MALFNWFGGGGLYTAARFWSPRGVPVGAGDTAVVGAGEVVVLGRQFAATVLLGGTNAGAPPALDLVNGTVAGLTMPNGLPGQPYTTLDSPAEYGTLNVAGQSAVGRISLGAYQGIERAPPPYGHGPLFAHDNLQVNLTGQAALNASFDVQEGSALTVTGGARSGLNAGGSALHGGKAVINAPLTGGAINMTRGAVSHEGFADVGTLELGGQVGAGVSINLDVGNLLIDKPLQFAGTLNIQAQEGNGDTHVAPGVGKQDVMLRGLAASSYAFDDATHRLTLFTGDAVLDTVQFSDATTSGSFAMGPYASVDVVQTAQGVQLRGIFDYSPAGSTEIPLHTAQSSGFAAAA